MNQITDTIKIFCCCSSKDRDLLDELKTHMSSLIINHSVDIWCAGDILAGADWEKTIREKLDEAEIILLLISPSFIDSKYCSDIEMKYAVERHELKKAKVIPVILRPSNWKNLPFGKGKQLRVLQALPKGGRPITMWEDHDEPWNEVVKEIERVVNELRKVHASLLKITSLPTIISPSPHPVDDQVAVEAKRMRRAS